MPQPEPNQEPESEQKQESNPQNNELNSIKLFGVVIPRWVVEHLIKNKNWMMPFILASLGLNVFTFYELVKIREPQGKSFVAEPSKNSPKLFSKSFLFWIPKFDSNTVKVKDPVTAEKKFNEKLKSIAGGWTRWEVKGSDSNETENGYLYLISIPTDKNFSSEEIETMIDEYFVETTHYVLQFNH